MPNIRTLAPEAGRIDAAGLRAYDADRLARCAVDRAAPWWRRTACVEALTGRVPQARLGELLACVRDGGDNGTVRRALLGLLSDRAELLPWLRHEDRRAEEAYGMPEAVLKARGALGALTAAAELATLAFSHWSSRRAVGEAGIDALADPDPAVAHLAQSLLTCPDRIRAYLAEAPTADAALWAAYALHRLTGDAARTRAVYESLGRPRVEVEGLDEEVRRAIVHEYGHECEKQSDPRWRIEALCTDSPHPPDEERQVAEEERRLALAGAALTAAGLMPRPPLSCGQVHRQGGGTYHVIGYGEGGRSEVLVSTLGPFAGGDGDDPAARAALEAAGFHWIDGPAGAVRVTGLGVYYFGAREPLDVSTLLFYWQD